MRLIDADELLQKQIWMKPTSGNEHAGMCVHKNDIMKAPTIDPVERGKWEPVAEYPTNPWYKQCSECGTVKETMGATKYCPHCGAKMKEGTE